MIPVGCVLRTHRPEMPSRRGACKARTLHLGAFVMYLVSSVAVAQNAKPDAVSARFRTDPIAYFISGNGTKWVGAGRYFMANYADTLVIKRDSTGRGAVVRRTLVNLDDTVVVSRGGGTVVPDRGDSTFTIRWSERRYPNLTGRMRWEGDQWVIAFEGSWGAWSIRMRADSANSVTASAGFAMAPGKTVELAALTYHRIGPSR